MKKNALYILILVALTAIAAIVWQAMTRETAPRRVLLDSDWLFIEGSHPEAIPDSTRPMVPDTTGWQHVDLPHDFASLPRDRERCQIPDSMQAVGPFAQTSPGKAATGWTLGGEGWYMRRLKVQNADFSINSHKHLELYFEGAYNQTHVWVNGHEVGSNMYGYTTFRFDITPFLLRDAKGRLDNVSDNIITVQVINEGKNSRWYAGAGIYRHVWLQITDPLKLDTWHTFAHTSRLADINPEATTAGTAGLLVETEIFSSDRKQDGGIIQYEIQLIDPTTQALICSHTNNAQLAEGETSVTVRHELTLADAKLWNCQHPFLYDLHIRARQGEYHDEIVLPVGIRTIAFSPTEGFLLNGQPTLLRGACIHHDNGLLGACAYDRAEQRKIALLRQAGFNAIRGSHNPMSETLMAECDRQGMLVIDEAFDMWHKRKNKQDYHQYFDSLSSRDLKALVRRDRNHPSLIMYSIGNEIPERADSLGVVIAAQLRSDILDLDETRPVTAGINSIWNQDRTRRLTIEPACRSLDVAGYNYRVWNYEPEHREDPHRVMFGSETVLSELAYDWKRVEQFPWVVGDFVWTGMDYIGEAGIANCLTADAQENVHFFMPWPWFNGWCGNIDLIGQLKPQHYYQAAVWGDVPVAINVEPSRYTTDSLGQRLPGERPSISYWGWMDEQHQWYQPGCEGDSIRVNVYSRDSLVHLYLNDSLVAQVQLNDSSRMGHALVPYVPGTLRAVIPGHAATPREAQAATLITPDDRQPQLRLTPDRTELTADGQDLCYVLIELVDHQGRLIPQTGRRLSLAPSPAQQLVGSGNAQPDDMASFGSLTPTLFRGQAMAILRATKTPGKSLLRVSSEGLLDQSVTINCR